MSSIVPSVGVDFFRAVFRPRKKTNTSTAIRRTTPNTTPTPIPAFAPFERPLGGIGVLLRVFEVVGLVNVAPVGARLVNNCPDACAEDSTSTVVVLVGGTKTVVPNTVINVTLAPVDVDIIRNVLVTSLATI